MADLNQRTPVQHERWSSSRILRSKFIEQIFLEEPYRSAIPSRGIQIAGAWFREALVLSQCSVDHEVGLYSSYFEKPVNFYGF